MESVKKTMLTAPVRMMNNKDTVTFDTEVYNSKFVCFAKTHFMLDIACKNAKQDHIFGIDHLHCMQRFCYNSDLLGYSKY
jgi:hypothetical protein